MLKLYNTIRYNGNSITDISQFFTIKEAESNKVDSIYTYHQIEGWKSPENVAYDFYGSCDYVWVVFLCNDVVDPIEDWLKTPQEVYDMCVELYGISEVNSIHHYEKGDIVFSYPYSGSTSITNYQYELDKNETKRNIKLIRPSLISTIETEAKVVFEAKDYE